MKSTFTQRGEKVRLDDIPCEPPKGMTREKAAERLLALGKEMFELQDTMWGAKGNSVLVVLQGRDSAGKDGAIKHVAGFLNPRGVHVASFGVPTEEERQHDFLWRVHRHAPRLGEFAIFNRSHYEDVLVTRVRGLMPKKLWRERYGHIADFEELLAEHGTIVLKYFLHITKAEQKKRLLEREKAPETAWKLNPNDWVERDYWDDYTEAYEDAIAKTAAP
ncbi:MAG TPA: PPK2 family polyphosphate kinase, partial [Burkholderiales bacterium]|nr:PPK2 family polyphosphate kinase [Burkholderiales bacterium]